MNKEKSTHLDLLKNNLTEEGKLLVDNLYQNVVDLSAIADWRTLFNLSHILKKNYLSKPEFKLYVLFEEEADK